MSKTHSRQINELATIYNMSLDYLDNLSSVIGISELEALLSMKKNQLNSTIRFNLMKASTAEIIEKLQSENISVKSIPNIPEAYIVTKGQNKIGSSYSYLSGEIMPQGYGSMLSVHNLDPRPGEFILDLSAAPGGKSCFIGERLKGKGLLIANEYSHSRAKSLIYNLARQGITNSITTIQEGSRFTFPQLFDKVLLDAPCSGDGLIISQPELKSKKSLNTSYTMQKTQKSLLRNAISLLKPHGICVYSTCSLNTVENEEVIFPFLPKIQLLETNSTGIPGSDALHPSFQLTTRLLPTKHACDGFYIAKFLRL